MTRGPRLCLLVAGFCWGAAGPGTAQAPITLQFDGFAETETPSVVHVARVSSALTKAREWLEPALVDADGRCTIEVPPAKGLTLWQVAAPPWVWEVWAWPEADLSDQTYFLRPHPRAARRLQDVPGITHPAAPHHPMARRDSLSRLTDSLWSAVSYDILLRSGAIQGGAALSDAGAVVRADSAFAAAWERWGPSPKDAPATRSMLESVQVDWHTALGQAPVTLWQPDDFGATQAWIARHLGWWDRPEADPQSMADAIQSEDLAALRLAMGGHWSNAAEEECLAAWLLKEMVAPDRLSKTALAAFTLPPNLSVELAEFQSIRKEGKPGQVLEDFRWTTPSGDLEAWRDFKGEGWLICLVVQGGSSTAQAEREVFQRIAESWSDRRRDLQFVVLSIDVRDADWQQTIRSRPSRRENTRWLGVAPSRWASWGIAAVPCVVAINPCSELSGAIRSLPSAGLQGELLRTLR